MKKIFLFALASLISVSMMAQGAKKKTVPASVKTTAALKSADDSVCYAIGLTVASFFKQQNIQNYNTAMVVKAINDNMKGGSQLLNEQQANAVMMICMSRAQMETRKKNAAKAAPNKIAGDAFLAENKTKAGVVALPSGLQYQVLTEGSGPKPVATDKVKCHYQGFLLDGREFESSIKRGTPAVFTVTGVIAGWSEALQLMPVGSKWRIFIPSDLGYGDEGSGDAIKPGSTLIFDIELLEIVK